MDVKLEIPRLTERVYALEQKLSRMERQLAELTHTDKSPSESPVAEVSMTTPLPAAEAVPILPRPVEEKKKPFVQNAPEQNIESAIAGRWLNRIGLLLILIATAFALKYAFDNEWIGPVATVTLGIISGASLLMAGQWLRHRGYGYFSEGITALGGGVLYLSLYAGWDFYKLLSSEQAFAAMIAVTVAILWIAGRLNSERVSQMALVGGFLTPVLVSTGQNAESVLFSYILILDASLLWLARKYSWRTLEPVAFVFSTIYFWEWYSRFYHVSEPTPLTVLFASLFFAVFAALPVIRSCTKGRIYDEHVVQMLFNAINYLFALHTMLWPDHRGVLTGAVVTLAAIHMAINRAIPRKEDNSPVVRMLFAGLALTFVSLAIPIRLDGIWITMAWSIEGAALVWNGFRVRWGFLRIAGLVLFAGVVWRFCFSMPDANVFLLNQRFATFVVAIASAGAAVYFWSRERELTVGNEADLFNILAIGVNILALWALSLEVRQYFSNYDDQLGRQLALSLLWTVYAGVLFVFGVRRNAAGLRWQGLVLLGFVVAKVFLYDLSFLSGGYQIVSSIALGVMLLGVSFLYQRRTSTS